MVGAGKTGVGSTGVSVFFQHVTTGAMVRWDVTDSGSTYTPGSTGKVKSSHKLDLNDFETFGVGLRGYMDTIEGKFFFYQTGENSANTIVKTPRNSFAKVVAKCPDKYT